ncbi:hypothetical protein EDB81DRAFT_283781 [Dactylonectria macrodidyma]|uniref:Alcohol dehydrogenase iron-type/glycerol dehydrogenase GldA domain-containing protein n=1 Tax=Dactylonectria macrodidyma TaxID=307937 RepID=A0A9P9FLJ0_9HYPO|nr:hypothetical protein EDB81DRAFT_283781 [Dactylonectria macrodidyma]
MKGPFTQQILVPPVSMPPVSTESNANTAAGTKISMHLAKGPPRPLSRLSASRGSVASARETGPDSGVRASSSPRIVLGPGVLDHLPQELRRLGLAAPLIVASPSRTDLTARIHAIIPGFDRCVLDPSVIERFPAHSIDDDEAVAAISGRDCVVGVGGGSALALARIIALRKGIPHVYIPTTYSGSEYMGEELSFKEPQRDRRRRKTRTASHSKPVGSKPVVIIYDEDLTISISSTLRMTTPGGTNKHGSAHPGESRHRIQDDALWSYMNLPGI